MNIIKQCSKKVNTVSLERKVCTAAFLQKNLEKGIDMRGEVCYNTKAHPEGGSGGGNRVKKLF